MDISIGVQNSGRELTVETSATSKSIATKVSDAINKNLPIIEFEDDNGKRIIVPTAALAYVEIGSDEPRRVGFGTN